MRTRFLPALALLGAVVVTSFVLFTGPASAENGSAPAVAGGRHGAAVALPELFAGTPPKGYAKDATPAMIAAGQSLFVQNCSSCHGVGAVGTDRAPSLIGRGPAEIDFWVSTGRMPLSPSGVHPVRRNTIFNDGTAGGRRRTLDVVAYVSSLGPGGIPIPDVSGVGRADVSEGEDLFAMNCAGCHTVTGAGDALANGDVAPSLHFASPEQVAEALRTGPRPMPIFGPTALTPQQLDDVIAYVTEGIQHPDNAGGWGLGGVGPVAEGFVGLLMGVGLLMLICLWIGDRA